MELYGISGTANKLIQSYLNNRYQRVLLQNNSFKYFSKWDPVTHTVPQGLDHYFLSCTLLIFLKLCLIHPTICVCRHSVLHIILLLY